MKIVVAEKIAKGGTEALKQIAGATVIGPEEFAADRQKALLDADALIVRSAVQADEALLSLAKQLKVIGRAGVGVDNIDMPAATRRGIVVMNTPGVNAVAVAEHTLGLMLSLARQIPRADATMHAGKWEKKSLQGSDLKGKTLGIVGFGRIGRKVARRALAFNMKVIAYDPFVSLEEAHREHVTMQSLDEVFSAADYLSLHLALTPETSGIINAANIQKMKPGVRIVNCARGELVNETDLLAAIAAGKVAGAALDVFVEEPLKSDALRASDKVLLTPHIAGSTAEAQDAVGVAIAQQVSAYLTRGVAQNAVNVPSLSDIEYRELQPVLELAERLGVVMAQLISEPVTAVEIAVTANYEKRAPLIANAALSGLLANISQDPVNLVNAATVAKDRGIETKSSADLDEPFCTLRLVCRGKQTERSICGLASANTGPRIVKIQETHVDAPLERDLLVIENEDVPGAIGNICSQLGAAGINIGFFSLGRGLNGSGRAIAVCSTDVSVPKPVLEKLQALHEVRNLRSIHIPR